MNELSKDDAADILYACILALTGAILVAPIVPEILNTPGHSREEEA